jgi:hypothetical protein
MSEPERQSASTDEDQADEASQGPNLVLLYSLIALALVAAIAFALMIVMPFYQRR